MALAVWMQAQPFERLLEGDPSLLHRVERLVVGAHRRWWEAGGRGDWSEPKAYHWLRYEDPDPVARLADGLERLAGEVSLEGGELTAALAAGMLLGHGGGEPRSALAWLARDLDPVVDALRLEYDPIERLGVPAHVTILVPWLPAGSINDTETAAIRRLAAGAEPFEVTFAGCGRFTDTVHLEPDPAAPFARLTEAVAAAWPSFPAYGGRFDTVHPHLTVGHFDSGDVAAEIEAKLAPRLPLRAQVNAISLLIEGADRRWRERERLTLGGSPGPDGRRGA